MNNFETWDGDVDGIQYEQLKSAFDNHFASRENIVATRNRFLCMEQRRDERLDKYILYRKGRTEWQYMQMGRIGRSNEHPHCYQRNVYR